MFSFFWYAMKFSNLGINKESSVAPILIFVYWISNSFEFLCYSCSFDYQKVVVENQGYENSYTCPNLVHCTILPRCPVMTSKWWHDSRISLECWECKKYLICYVIMTSSVNEKGQFLHICNFFHQFMSILYEVMGCYENSFISNLRQLCK